MLLLHVLWMLIAGLVGALVASGFAALTRKPGHGFFRTLLAAAAQTAVCWAATEWIRHDLSVLLTVVAAGVLIHRYALRATWPFSVGFALAMIPAMIFTMKYLRRGLTAFGLLD